jgi:hypothetical protein
VVPDGRPASPEQLLFQFGVLCFRSYKKIAPSGWNAYSGNRKAASVQTADKAHHEHDNTHWHEEIWPFGVDA